MADDGAVLAHHEDGCGGRGHGGAERAREGNENTTKDRPEGHRPNARLARPMTSRSRLLILALIAALVALVAGCGGGGGNGAAAPEQAIKTVGKVKLVSRSVKGLNPKDLRGLVDDGKKQVGSGVVAIVGVTGTSPAAVLSTLPVK